MNNMFYMNLFLMVIFTSDTQQSERSVDTCNWKECQVDCHENVCICIDSERTCIADMCADVIDLELEVYITTLDTRFRNSNCTKVISPSTQITEPSRTPGPTCQSKLPKNFTVGDMNGATLHPVLSLTNPLCKKHSYHALRHCSLFTLSHLRSFGKENIQTCILPGSWYLLHHPDITIEIYGGIKNSKSLYTNIDVINITLQSESCTIKTTFNYVAKADEDLPVSISSTDSKIIPLFRPLEFNIDSLRTTASILAPWLNLTLIVRKQDKYLSVVTRLPADLVDQSGGLCNTGCPTHTEQSIEHNVKLSCVDDQNSAIIGCGGKANLLNALKDQSNLTIQLIENCQFDVLNSLTYTPLSLYKGIVQDYKALPNYGDHIVPQPNSNLPIVVPDIKATMAQSPNTIFTKPSETLLLKQVSTTGVSRNQ